MSRTIDDIATDAICEGIKESVIKKLGEYKSPLDAILTRTFEKHQAKIDLLFDKLITESLLHVDFERQLQDAFTKKLAKVLLSNFEGEIERRAGKLREDSAFRAKIIVAIDEAIKSVGK